MCEKFKCLYTDLMKQPQWWLDRYELYKNAQTMAEKIRAIKDDN